jgi:hypothetical protein
LCNAIVLGGEGQLNINFALNATCSDDYTPGVCNPSSVIVVVGDNPGSGNSTVATGTNEQFIQGYSNFKVFRKVLSNDIQFDLDYIQFDLDCKISGWASVGFEKGNRIYHATDTYVAWILSSGYMRLFRSHISVLDALIGAVFLTVNGFFCFFTRR